MKSSHYNAHVYNARGYVRRGLQGDRYDLQLHYMLSEIMIIAEGLFDMLTIKRASLLSNVI